MSSFRFSRLLVFTALAAFFQAAYAQQITPHIGYIFPAGGRQGSSFEVKIGGQRLVGASRVHVSGKGVEATVVEYVRPLTPKEAKDLREKLQELMKKPKDDAAWKQIAEIRKKLATFVRKPNPVLAETVTLKVTVAPDADPGPRELRVGAATGLSNPMAFHVGQLPEVTEKEAKPAVESRKGKLLQQGAGLRVPAPEPEMQITLPATVNGQIMPGDVDRFRFEARKGQQIVVAVRARELVPYMADAVPGWFQATIVVYDSKGDELAYDDRWRFHPDPVLSCKIPADGRYVLEIKDSLYRGREDFVYRVAIGELPFITGVFPLGGPAGGKTEVQLSGWNLKEDRLTVDAKDRGTGVIPLLPHNRGQSLNLVLFALDDLPESLEKEPNDQPAAAQSIALPLTINGRIDRPGDWDVFRFEGKAGQRIVAEVYARRLDSPLDSILRLTDAAGRQLAVNDDHEDKGSGLNTHHADSLLSIALPADGAYYLHLGDAQNKGGPEYAYRLRISQPRPDFALRVAPASVTARGGMTVPITVYALRKDGFDGEIVLSLADKPAGFSLTGARVPPGQDQVRLTLTAPSLPPEGPVSLSLEGRATVAGREIRRPAIPAEDMMQAFAYRHLVPADQLLVAVVGRGRGRSPSVIGQGPLKLPAGGTAEVKLSMPRGPMFDQVQLALSEPPEGITLQKTSLTSDGVSVVFQADAAKAKPGLQGNLIVQAFIERDVTGPAKKKAARQRVPLGTLPAIPFEVISP